MEPYAEKLSVESREDNPKSDAGGKIPRFKYLLMLKAYIDDSGSDGEGIPYFLAGFLIAPEHCGGFAEDWRAELARDPAIDYFKMFEAHSYSGQFGKSDFRHVELRMRKVRELLGVLEAAKPVGIFSAVNWLEFRAMQKPYVSGAAQNPYHCLVPWLLDSVMAWQKFNEIYPTPIELVFDEQGEQIASAICSVYPKVKERVSESVRVMMGPTPQPGNEKKVIPLQAADMLAGTLRRHFDPKRKDDAWEWLYRKMQQLCTEGAFGPGSADGMQIFQAWQDALG